MTKLFRGLSVALACVLMVAAMRTPGLAAAAELHLYNASANDAWVTIQNGNRTATLASFHLAAGARENWKAVSDVRVFVRFQFMHGHESMCETKAAVFGNGGGSAKHAVGVFKNGSCSIERTSP